MAAEDVFLVQKTEMYREYSLPFDWKKIGKRRKTATDSINSSKNWDFYLISPDGKKFRSNVEVSKYLQNHPEINYEPSVTKVSTPSDLIHSVCFISNVYKQRFSRLVEILKKNKQQTSLFGK